MVQSGATSVEAYLRELPEERRAVVSRVRELVREHLPAGYSEAMGWGMITYGVPLERFPDTYNGQPLCYIGLAAQKNHFSLYLMGAYTKSAVDAELRSGFARAGKPLDKGQSCVRFKRLDELPFDVLARAIAAIAPEELMALHAAAHSAEARAERRAARTAAPATKAKTAEAKTAKTKAAKAQTTKTKKAAKRAGTKSTGGTTTRATGAKRR
ncbi:MAG TPA: DUF1801 domain-containing protein [Gemmatimonadaceae bacterium]|nr:DUF1801 domain-containing protein [Gemmatimonadaceae bacterium]